MNKAELLAELTAKYESVYLVENAPATQKEFDWRLANEGYAFYKVGVESVSGDTAKRGTVWFKVWNEGEANEIARWEERLPPDFIPPETDKTLDAIAEAYIAENKPPGYVRHDFIEFSRESAYATVKFTLLIDGEISFQNYWIGYINGSPAMHPLAA